MINESHGGPRAVLTGRRKKQCFGAIYTYIHIYTHLISSKKVLL